MATMEIETELVPALYDTKRSYFLSIFTHVATFWEECLHYIGNSEVQASAATSNNLASTIPNPMSSHIKMLISSLLQSHEKQQIFDKLFFKFLFKLHTSLQHQKQHSKDSEANVSNSQISVKDVIEKFLLSDVSINIPKLLDVLKSVLQNTKSISNVCTKESFLRPFKMDQNVSKESALHHSSEQLREAFVASSVDTSSDYPTNQLKSIHTCVLQPSSERYIVKHFGGEVVEWDEADEYHNDDDPGYRVSDLWESEYPLQAFCAVPPFPEAHFRNSPYIDAGQMDGMHSVLSTAKPIEAATSDRPPSPTFGSVTELSTKEQSDEAICESETFVHSDHATNGQPYRITSNMLYDDEVHGAFAAESSSSTNDHTFSSLPTTFLKKQSIGASLWEEEFEHGDFSEYLKKKRMERLSDENLALYPSSCDPLYPLKVPCNDKSPSDFYIVDSFNLKVLFERNKTSFDGEKELCLSLDSVVAGRYKVEFQLGEAAFSRAVQCVDLLTGLRRCMKVIKNDKESVDQSLVEIMLLRYINSNGDTDEFRFLKLFDFFYYRGHLIIVTELLCENLYSVSKYCKENGLASYFTMGRLQKITYQVLVALKFIHSLHLIHCDVKPENILIQNITDCTVKLIDFGSSRFDDYGCATYIQSRPYRAPECLLGLPYNEKIDIWSLGCVIAELWSGYVLFQSGSVQGLMARLVGIIGKFPLSMVSHGLNVPSFLSNYGYMFQMLPHPPSVTQGRHYRLLWPKKSSLYQRMRTHDTLFLDFLTSLLEIDPTKRVSASDALKHPWLTPGLYVDGR